MYYQLHVVELVLDLLQQESVALSIVSVETYTNSIEQSYVRFPRKRCSIYVRIHMQEIQVQMTKLIRHYFEKQLSWVHFHAKI